jgi:thiamine-monophosphate kinase
MGGSGERPVTLADVGEDGLVASVITVAARGAAAGRGALDWLRVGPGDDAAVLALTGLVAASTDTLVEGHDFLRQWSGGHDVGVKAAAQNFADVAAMGAAPRALLVSVAAPRDLPAEWVREFAEGLADECARAGAVVVGGDVSGAEQIVVTGTALGVVEGAAPVRRSGARPGDVVALAGVTGRSAAGLALLQADARRAGVPRGALRVVDDHLRPRPPHGAGPAAARAGATAMIDTSDGLLRDAGRVATASGVVLDLDPAALRADDDVAAVASLLDADAQEWVLSGGEDHALLACFPAGSALPEPFRPVGRVLAADGGESGVRVGGEAWNGAVGWRHFE